MSGPVEEIRKVETGLPLAHGGKRRWYDTLAKNSAANMVRLGMTSLVGILLPAYLTKHLPLQTYSAWVLILQLGAYVGYLDFGVQTAVSKYVAEYEAKRDLEGCGRSASAGLLIMLMAGGSGVLMTLGLAWRVPELFRNIPAALLSGVRISVLFVGISLCVTLVVSVFSAIFLGLQRYRVTMMTAIISRLLYAAVLCVAVYLHSSLPAMAASVAIANLIGAMLQVIVWRELASHIKVSLHSIDMTMLKQMLEYCAVMTVWSVCMLFISGIDITIVGRYDFGEVGYYSIASAPTSLILSLIGALMGPLLPATSALSVESSPEQLGGLLLKATRYVVIFLLVTGLPILLWGHFLLKIWVGSSYAIHSVQYLRILLIANVLRNFCGPYATMVVATSNQRLATASGIVEGVVNLVSSILLARHYGAWGVAFGTLIGSVAGLTMHFAVSMRYTRKALDISRMELLTKGLAKPAILAIPAILLVPYWWGNGAGAMSGPMTVFWIVSTLCLGWFVSVAADDRKKIISRLREAR